MFSGRMTAQVRKRAPVSAGGTPGRLVSRRVQGSEQSRGVGREQETRVLSQIVDRAAASCVGR